MAEAPTWSWRTETLRPRVQLPGWRRAAGGRLEDGAGGIVLIAGEPAVRQWTPHGILASSRPVDWSVRDTADGCEIRGAEPADVDLLELHGDAATAMPGAVAPMTVLGSFAPVGGAATLGSFLVGSEVLDTNDFGGRRCPSEQTALSLYRIARLRGGPFWNAVAEHIAGIVARRIAATSTPAHGVYGGEETHTRFLADAALLLVAARRDELARRAVDGLDRLSVAYGGGRWTLHDSGERDEGANHLVLNTHVQATIARLALGDDVTPDLRALDAALRLRLDPGRAWRIAGRLLAADAVQGWMGRQTGGGAQGAAASARRDSPHLVLPSGWIARDTGLGPAPAYLTVNLYDLAGLCANRPTPAAVTALRRGMRYARLSGYFRGQRSAAHPQVVVQPIALRMAGHSRAARRAAVAARGGGWAPAVGWPGHEDSLWPALTAGTP